MLKSECSFNESLVGGVYILKFCLVVFYFFFIFLLLLF
jgi:hypothetical protein